MIECSTDTCNLIVNTIIPILGGLVAVGISLAPMTSVIQINAKESLGQINSLPYSVLYANSLSWVLYGYLIVDYYILVPNYVMLLITLYYTLSTFRYASKPTQNLIMGVMLGTSALLYLGAMFSFMVFPNAIGRNVMGILCCVIQVLFYTSPLSTVARVIRSRNAISLHLWLTATCTLNAVLWTIYGLVVKNDPYIYGPNGLGLLFSIFQILLILVFGRRDSSESVLDNDTLTDSIVVVSDKPIQ